MDTLYNDITIGYILIRRYRITEYIVYIINSCKPSVDLQYTYYVHIYSQYHAILVNIRRVN